MKELERLPDHGIMEFRELSQGAGVLNQYAHAWLGPLMFSPFNQFDIGKPQCRSRGKRPDVPEGDDDGAEGRNSGE